MTTTFKSIEEIKKEVEEVSPYLIEGYLHKRVKALLDVLLEKCLFFNNMYTQETVAHQKTLTRIDTINARLDFLETLLHKVSKREIPFETAECEAKQLLAEITSEKK